MVDEIITRQELIDAQKDAKTLEDVINGAADTQVTARLGRKFWTLATLNSKLNSVETAATQAIASMNLKVVEVETAATQGLISIDNDVASVEAARVVAESQMNAKVASVEQIFDDKLSEWDDEAQTEINEWRSAIALITQEDGVPALAVSDASGVTQQEINNIVYKSLNLVENWGAKGDGVSQDKTYIQAAIDSLHEKWLTTGYEQTLLFMSDKTYVCDGISWKAGVHFDTYGKGKARLLKTPATVGQPEAELKWRKILLCSTNMSTLGNTIRHKLSNIILDGNMDNMNWTFDSYNQEQGMCLILSCLKGTVENDRGKFELDNVEFVNSVSDGVCVNTNIDVIVNNCSGSRDFRGGVTIVGGNSIVQINNWIGENAHIHIEVDSSGFDGTLKTDVTVNGGEVDRVLGKSAIWGGNTAQVKGGANVIYNNFKCYSGGLNLTAGDTNPLNKIIFNNCTLSWNGGGSYNIPKLLQFNFCEFLSDFRGQTEVTDGWRPYWNTAYTDPTDGAEIVFNGGRAVGMYDTPELAGAFIRLNLGGASHDEMTNPFKRVVFTGGFHIEGFAQPYGTANGGVSVKYDDVHINTPNFLVGNFSAGASGGGNLNIELGKLYLGSKNTQFYRINGGSSAVARISFNGTVIPADKLIVSESTPVYWDVRGQLTVTADNPTSVTLSNFKCFSGSRLVFINTVKGGVAECIAYPDGTNGSGSKLTRAWSVSKMITNPVVSAQKTYDPPSIAAGATDVTTVTLTGVAVGDVVQAAFSQYNADLEISAVVSAANTVTVKFKNTGAAAVDLASGTLTVKLI